MHSGLLCHVLPCLPYRPLVATAMVLVPNRKPAFSVPSLTCKTVEPPASMDHPLHCTHFVGFEGIGMGRRGKDSLRGVPGILVTMVW